MRKLFWFTVGFAGAVLALTKVLWGHGLLMLLASTLVLILSAVCFRVWPKMAIPLAMAIGLTAGSGWMLFLQKTYYEPFYILDGQTLSAEILALDYGEETDYGVRVRGRVYLEGLPYDLLVYLKDEVPIEPGNTLTGRFLFRLTLPGGEKESPYYPGSGILATASAKTETAVETGQAGSARFFPKRLAGRMKEILRLCLGEEYPFAQALLLGDSRELDYETKTALTVSGIRHVIAVSGLHVAVLYALIQKLTGGKPWLTAILGIPTLILFAALVGFTPSVCRASLMLSMMLLAGAIRREYDGLTELAFAAFVLLVRNPFTVQAVGFQLSVLSVLGIFLFESRLQAFLEAKLGGAKGKGILPGCKRWLAGSVAVTLSASSLSTPVAAGAFGVVSLIGPLTNLLVLGLISLIFYGVGLVCALGAVYLPIGLLLGHILKYPIQWVLAIAKLFASIPMAALYTCGGFAVAFLIGAYVLAGVRLLTGKGRIRYYALMAAALLAICQFLSWWVPGRDACRLTVLDVGQGQSLLLQSGSESLLIDCGGGSGEAASDAAAEELLSQNRFQLDGCAFTHFDADHMNGAGYLLGRVGTRWLALPGENPGLTDRAETAISVTADKEIPFGRGVLRLMPYTGSNSGQENSMVILFESKSCVILVTGDLDLAGERRLLETHSLPKADLLVVGHHGSKNATSEELLQAVSPRAAVISVGKNNHYGHPTQEVLDRLQNAGCTVYRTDQQGTIIFRVP